MKILAQLRSRFAPAAQLAACAAIVFFSTNSLRASDLPPALTLDVPIAPNLATPAWLGHPNTPVGPLATLGLPIVTPDTNASLLVTVYFQEKPNGFLRVSWKGALGVVMLGDNFYEGIGTANQRSLLISPATLAGDGTLIFQSGGSSSTTGIQRIKFEWLESRDNLVSSQVKEQLVTSSSGVTVPTSSIDGHPVQPTPPPTTAGAWENNIVTVPISDEAVRIEQGVDFSVDLDQVPGSARLGLKVSGLPLGQRLAVWINDKRAGTITPAVPELADTGYFTDPSQSSSFVGWRDGTFYVPVSFLKTGVNSLQFSPEDDATGAASTTTTPVALKTIKLQLNYTPPPTTPVNMPTLHLGAPTPIN